MPSPPPAVVPCAAATTGTLDSVSARIPVLMTSASAVISAPDDPMVVAMSITSPPAQNAGPAASMRMACTSSRDVASTVASRQA